MARKGLRAGRAALDASGTHTHAVGLAVMRSKAGGYYRNEKIVIA
jgi:hypothetical protein